MEKKAYWISFITLTHTLPVDLHADWTMSVKCEVLLQTLIATGEKLLLSQSVYFHHPYNHLFVLFTQVGSPWRGAVTTRCSTHLWNDALISLESGTPTVKQQETARTEILRKDLIYVCISAYSVRFWKLTACSKVPLLKVSVCSYEQKKGQ